MGKMNFMLYGGEVVYHTGDGMVAPAEGGGWPHVSEDFHQFEERQDQLKGRLEAAEQRASRLGDECGQLRAERDELLRENAVLRRKLEGKR